MTTPSDASQAVELPPLPEWDECARKNDRMDAMTPLERFVYDNEPAGNKDEADWRAELELAIHSVIAQDRAARAQGAGEAVAHLRANSEGNLRVCDPTFDDAFPVYRAAPTIPQAAEVASVPSAVPGFVLVPREPTEAMLAAIPWPTSVTPKLGIECYRAMLAAAPTPTASAPKAEGEALCACKDRPAVAVEAERELFEAWMNRTVDHDLLGNPVTQRQAAYPAYAMGLEAGWMARAALAARSAPAVAEKVPLTEAQIDEAITNWFAEDWAIKKARGLLDELGVGSGSAQEGQAK